MQLDNNVILITGGATGIGFAVAKKMFEKGNRVIICGRREEKLAAAKEQLNGVIVRKCDISDAKDRENLFKWVSSEVGNINVLVNNAGIQREIDLKKGIEELNSNSGEIEINFASQVSMIGQFMPMLIDSERSAIVNVSSGLGIVPLARFPLYCATKAALHSFTMSLRKQMQDTNVKVFEVLPPGVYDTELKGAPMAKSEWSISSDEMADAILKGLESDKYEITAGSSTKLLEASKPASLAFEGMNR